MQLRINWMVLPHWVHASGQTELVVNVRPALIAVVALQSVCMQPCTIFNIYIQQHSNKHLWLPWLIYVATSRHTGLVSYSVYTLKSVVALLPSDTRLDTLPAVISKMLGTKAFKPSSCDPKGWSCRKMRDYDKSRMNYLDI